MQTLHAINQLLKRTALPHIHAPKSLPSAVMRGWIFSTGNYVNRHSPIRSCAISARCIALRSILNRSAYSTPQRSGSGGIDAGFHE
jgi:hypothetical protein